ncbi:MAG: DUF2958 domain-containing protein [Planctomycetaceae bacterium]|nr:DUF2958 domain-containing protein [Planctomycetaceae bacterium]
MQVNPCHYALRVTAEQEDPIFHLKWFTPDGGFTWYVCEYDPITGIAFGSVVGPCPEWGTCSIHEIRSVRARSGAARSGAIHLQP